MESIKDKVIVITGASSGIGAAAAPKLVALGAKVVLAARRTDRLKALTNELGANAISVATDVSKKADVDQLIAKAIEAFGRIDVLWNNAGVMPISFFEEGRVEEWEQMVDVNIKGVLYGINAVLPHMLQNGSGHIVSTASVQAFKTFPGTGVYAGSKFAVRGIMDSLREELAGKVRTTTLYPGLVATEFVQHVTSPRMKEIFATIDAWPQLDAEAVADAFIYVIGQPAKVAVNELVIRPLEQSI
ncbi:MAG: SDR family oxidoreductase [Niastella sp.]|nr:SDR family oxidoreductase [Niastella sp.]